MVKESAATKNYRERAEHAETESLCMRRVMAALHAGQQPHASLTFADLQYGHYTYELWFPAAPDGGILVSYFKVAQQAPSVWAGYFDAACSDAFGHPSEYNLPNRQALEKLTIKRRAANEIAS